MNIAICDDEQLYIDTITSYLLTVSKTNNKGCNILKCNRGDALIELCQKKKIDAVFLDISMPGINGFETAEKLLKIRDNLVIVFVSSKESMVFNSYEYKPFWFVPKSKISMLEIVINKLIKKIEMDENESRSVTINVENNKVIDLNFREIAYFKTDDHYIQAVMKDKTKSISYRNKLDNIEIQLIKHWFIRIHSRYLVNCRMISTIEKTDCVLINGDRLPISRANMSKTKEKFQDYLRCIR